MSKIYVFMVILLLGVEMGVKKPFCILLPRSFHLAAGLSPFGAIPWLMLDTRRLKRLQETVVAVSGCQYGVLPSVGLEKAYGRD